MQGLRLVPLGKLAAAEDETERLSLGQVRREGGDEGPGRGEGVVDLDLLVRRGVGELGRPPADGPGACQLGRNKPLGWIDGAD